MSQEDGHLQALGVSHRHAPLELRERLYLTDGHAAELAKELGGRSCSRPATARRSTCSAAIREGARWALERRSGLELDGVLARWDGGEAVEHLFRVAAGLDSLVPGEAQILGQVREAYEAALQPGRPARC